MDKQAVLRQIPTVDRLMDAELDELLARYPRKRVLDLLRRLLVTLREEIVRGDSGAEALTVEAARG